MSQQSIEELEKQQLINTPPLVLPRLQFLLSLPFYKEKAEAKEKIIEIVKKNSTLMIYFLLDNSVINFKIW